MQDIRPLLFGKDGNTEEEDMKTEDDSEVLEDDEKDSGHQ